MKIRMMPHGALEILADTTVEMFALDSWYERWQERTATLHVQGYENSTESPYSIDTKMKQVDPLSVPRSSTSKQHGGQA